jgi:hypothetical protein
MRKQLLLLLLGTHSDMIRSVGRLLRETASDAVASDSGSTNTHQVVVI